MGEDDPNVSMRDNVLEKVNINEKKYKCPICEKNILDSNTPTHFKDFHTPYFYEDILRKLKEKDETIKKCLQDIANLKFIFENNAKNNSLKPNKNAIMEYLNLTKIYK